MHSFVSRYRESSNPAFFLDFEAGWSLADPSVGRLYTMHHFAWSESVKLFTPLSQNHSLFSSAEEDLYDQYNSYYILGFKNALLTPKEYVDKLTDYREENKALNFISAYYSSICQVNIILKVGFGVGDLKRDIDQIASTDQLIGAPYQLRVGYIIRTKFADICGYFLLSTNKLRG